MTNPSPETSTLAGAIRIARMHGLARQVPLILAMLVTGLLEGVGIATFFPILAIVTGSTSTPNRLNLAIEDGLAFFHLPADVPVLCTLAVAVIWLKAIISMLVARALGRIGATIGQEIRQRLLQALVNAKWSYFTIQPVGRFIAAATTEANWASTAFRNALQVIEQSMRTVILCGLAMFMGWKMALVAIGMGVLMGLSLRTLTRAAHLAGRDRQRAMRSLVVELNDVLAGFKPLKAMHRHTGLIGELIKDAKRLRKAVNRLVTTETMSIGLPDLIQTYLLAAGAYLSARVLGSPIDVVIVAGVISFAVMTNISRVRKAMTQLAQSDATYWALLGAVTDVEKAAEHFEGSRAPTLSTGCELRNVSFSYGRGPVLTDVALQVPAGRITTLVGESGSGKTTIADLLLGLYAPDNGTVTVDGVDLRDIDIGQWRSMIGYVPQEIILFNDTILANVSLGDQEIGEDRVRAALEAAGLGALLADLPDGLQSQIGERGFKLSGGQRQRIALARALVHQPKLLILDEATSALDPTTEAEICATVAAQAGRTTVLAITHQPSWVERADCIYKVEDGKVHAVDRASFRRGMRAAT
ncbi:MAG TPA: ABC transporter ATP-binding protein [Dongiaceae bacterium]|nr:ABC transporter ATP-binding protein [Dongiaceae bacterium]